MVPYDTVISLSGNEERGSGARNEDLERGTRIWDGVRNTLRP